MHCDYDKNNDNKSEKGTITISLQALQQQVISESDLISSFYDEVDFSRVPERFTDQLDVESTLPGRFA